MFSSLLFDVFTDAWVSVRQTVPETDCTVTVIHHWTGDRQLIALAPAAIRYRPTIVLIAPGSRSVKSMQ